LPIINQIVAEIAEKLGITPENVAEILEKLNLKPLDLLNDENLRAFVREFYQVSSNAELLNIPNINETIAALEQIIKNAVAPLPGTILTELTVLSAETKTYFPTDTNQLAQTTDTPEQSTPTATAQAITQPSQPAAPQNDNAPTQQQPQNTFGQNVLIKEETEIAQASNTTDSVKSTAKSEAASNIARQASPQEIIKQITEHIKTDVKAAINEVKIMLRPESLGELTLKISIERGIVTAHFVAESHRVKEIIESNMGSLKDALAESGVDVGQLDVSVSQGENESMQAFERERTKSAKRINELLQNAEQSADEPISITESEAQGAQVSYTA